MEVIECKHIWVNVVLVSGTGDTFI